MEYTNIDVNSLKNTITSKKKLFQSYKNSIESIADELESSNCGTDNEVLDHAASLLRKCKSDSSLEGTLKNIIDICDDLENALNYVKEAQTAEILYKKYKQISNENYNNGNDATGLFYYTVYTKYYRQMNNNVANANKVFAKCR